ncbi:hypothetical protein, partial [uncultured Nitrosomonas sp.]|uniref:hypothetical protein n=1 Tax=uncultured Nitrosomonas sp. TaxID=156424 RepID=UPI00261DC58C
CSSKAQTPSPDTPERLVILTILVKPFLVHIPIRINPVPYNQIVTKIHTNNRKSKITLQKYKRY